MPDTAAQALFRYLAGQLSVYLPAPFDPKSIEAQMSKLDDALTKLEAAESALAARVEQTIAADAAALAAGTATDAQLQRLANVIDAMKGVDADALPPPAPAPAPDPTSPPAP